MTNELFGKDKGRAILRELKLYTEDLPNYSPDEVREALDMAIKALEAQPKPMEKFDDVKTHIQRLAGDYKCWDNRLTWEEALELNRMLEAQPNSNEFFNFDAPMVKNSDAVSREAVIKNIKWWFEKIELNPDILIDSIITLPSVKPQYTDEEIDKAQAIEQAYVDKMVELAVEETKRPKGHWIIIDDCELFMAKCSECGEIVDSRMINKYPYCHCGARMIDPQKSEDEE